MTDFHHEVVDLLAYNIEINNNYHANTTEDSACIIEADILDWSTVITLVFYLLQIVRTVKAAM